MAPDLITLLSRAFEPTESLEPGDDRYVDLDDVRGENFVRGYARSLWNADPSRPDIRVFAGHRGVGKTCELKRLQRLLEQPCGPFAGKQPFFVIFIDVDPVAVDFNDIDWPDLLIHISSKVIKTLRERQVPGFGAFVQLMKDRWEALKATLGADVTIAEAELDVEIAALALDIRNRPSSRLLLRQAIERHGTGIQRALDDLLETANIELRSRGYAGLVLLVDGLELVPRRTLDDGSVDLHERLFIRRCTQWANLKANMIMTVPISLLYTKGFTIIGQDLGETARPVPMIRIHEYEQETVDSDHLGMKKLKEIIARRCARAGTDILRAFDAPGTIDYLCEQSGGHPRNLLRLIVAALNQIDDLPVTRVNLERVVRNEANAMVREMPDAYWAHLRKFGKATKDCPSDEDHRSMLYLLHIFEYMNGEPWFEVNPILRSHPKFHRVAS